MHGWHTVKTWATTQSRVAMSSGESELYSMTKGAANALGLIALAADFGFQRSGKVHTDASATLGIVRRQGLGKLRHINVQYLWLQDRTRNGDLEVQKVAGAENPADLLTKHLAVESMLKHMAALNMEFPSGRARLAPTLSNINSNSSNSKMVGSEMYARQRHDEARWKLFAPSRLDGQAPIKVLMPVRITEGRFCDDGKEFCIVDNLRSKANACRDLGRKWIGETRFVYRSS